jgi:excisionase family DNA binding protein
MLYNIGMKIDGIQYLTIMEASAFLNLCRQQIWRYIKNGTLATTLTLGNRTLVAKTELEELRPRLRKKRNIPQKN